MPARVPPLVPATPLLLLTETNEPLLEGSSTLGIPAPSAAPGEPDGPSSHLVIGFFGEFNAGKSSLLNSLLGGLVQAVDVQPTTARICAIVDPGDRKNRVEGAQRVEVRSPWLRWRVQFWDTPGWNAEDASHAKWAEQATREIGAAVYVLDATKAIHRSDVKQFEVVASALSARGGPAPLLALSHFDRFVPESDEDEKDLLDDVRRHLGVALERVFRIHAGDLHRFDGARFRDDLQRLILADRQARLADDVARERSHPLRVKVAMRADWRSELDQALVSDPLVRTLGEWDQHCADARLAFRRARIAAVAGYPREAAEAARAGHAARIEGHERGWTGWSAGVEARAILREGVQTAAACVLAELHPAKLMSKFGGWLAGATGGTAALAAMAGAAIIGTGGLALLLLIPLIAIAGMVLFYVAAAFVALIAVGPCLVGLLWALYGLVHAISVCSHGFAEALMRTASAAALLFGLLVAPIALWRVPGRLRRSRETYLRETGQAPPVEAAITSPRGRRAASGSVHALPEGPLHQLPCMRVTLVGIPTFLLALSVAAVLP